MRQALDPGDVIVLGRSMHSVFALDYATRYPARVRGVVLIGGAPRGDEAEFVWLWADASQEGRDLFARQQAELTPELRATLSPTELFVREYVARGQRSGAIPPTTTPRCGMKSAHRCPSSIV